MSIFNYPKNFLKNLYLGLRSPRLGEQSEAIVKFPRLFERFPFPVLINTALLKERASTAHGILVILL